MLVYIAGSGAMGCTIGYQINKHSDNEVILLDYWQDHIDAINQNGLTLEGGKVEDKLEFKAMKPEEATEVADLIVVMTKSMQLENMMKSLDKLIDDNTQILCLLNGMGHEAILTNYVDLDQINMGVTNWAANLNGPGNISITGMGSIEVQNIGDNPAGGQKAVDILNQGEMNATLSDNAMWAIWRKVMVNATMNSLCSLLEVKIGELFSTEAHKEIVDQIITEAVEAGNASGVDLKKEDMVEYVYHTAETAADHYPSMYQDLVKNNRKTEIDFINGAIVRKGKENGVETPVNEVITKLIHLKEELKGID